MSKIITPQDFALGPMARGQTLDISRPPFDYTCPCGCRSIVIVPKWAGAVVWQCGKCNRRKRITFDAVGPDDVAPDDRLMALRRKPLWHTCQDCGEHDYIVLPVGSGELRWSCKCGSNWVIRFDEKQGRLGKLL